MGPIHQNSLVAVTSIAHTTQIVHGGIRVHTNQFEDQLTSRNEPRGIEAMDLLPKERSHGLTQQRRNLLGSSTQQQHSAQGKQSANQKNA